MKNLFVILVLSFLSVTCSAQDAQMQYRAKKEIRAISGKYFVYFSMHDIKEAFMQLPQKDQQYFSELMDLPDGVKATVNIVAGSKAYNSVLETVLQRFIGGHLLKQGLAFIETKEGKAVPTVHYTEGTAIQDDAGNTVTPVSFYEPGTTKQVFSGTINSSLK
jgi:hypothetical protein